MKEKQSMMRIYAICQIVLLKRNKNIMQATRPINNLSSNTNSCNVNALPCRKKCTTDNEYFSEQLQIAHQQIH